MFKCLLVAIFVLACQAQDLSLVRPVAPICLGLKAEPNDENEPKAALTLVRSPDGSDEGSLSEEQAKDLLGASTVSVDPVLSRSAASVSDRVVTDDNGAAEARKSLVGATGKVIESDLVLKPSSVCPPLNSLTSGGQELCPSTQVLHTQYYSSNGKCYILYPYWRRIYKTRCLCRQCRNSCPYSVFTKPYLIRYRNYCTAKYKRSYSVVALCIKGWKWPFGVKFVKERITVPSGGCECKAYRTCY